MLRIVNLSKKYAKSSHFAVSNLNLQLREGEIFGFLGPNGAGKTTTIKSVTGILPYDEGTVEICGYNLKDDATNAKRSFGYVSDSHIIYDKLTGREYVNFLASIYRVPVVDARERTQYMLDKFGLTGAYDQSIRTYSHGMKQKISIIGAMVHSPKLWILDEPMTGLDPQSNFELKELMRQHCDKGNTVFFSTHILDVAERLCDRIGIIVKGQLVAIGTFDELRGSQDVTLEDIFINLANNAI